MKGGSFKVLSMVLKIGQAGALPYYQIVGDIPIQLAGGNGARHLPRKDTRNC